MLDSLVGDPEHPGVRLDGPVWHTLHSDPEEWRRVRRRQMAYVCRYAPCGHPSLWDNVPVLEFLAFHNDVANIIAAENNSSRSETD